MFDNIDSKPLGNLLQVKQLRGGGVRPRKILGKLKMPSLKKGIIKKST